jgi:hypothetical protein
VIARNAFHHNGMATKVERTDRVQLLGNSYDDVGTLSLVTGEGEALSALAERPDDGSADPLHLLEQFALDVAPIEGAWDAMLPEGARRGRETIIVDEWGPYSWRYPRLWPAGRSDARPQPLRVLGPAGRWRLVETRGASVGDSAGATGDTIVVTPTGPHDDWQVVLEYVGERVVTRTGDTLAAGTPVRFEYGRFRPAQRWRGLVATWDSGGVPDTVAIVPAQAVAVLDGLPALDWMWFRPRVAGIPATNWMLSAATEMTLPAGAWRLRTVSDDAIRVRVDGRLVIDHWTPHESAVDEAPIESGTHRLEVEYLQRDGWVELRLEVLPR